VTTPNSPYNNLPWHRELLLPFIVTIALSLIMPAVALATSQEPRLLKNIEVQQPLVTLADLIENAGIKGSTPVFRSPDPGTTGKVSVRRIIFAAQKYGLKFSVPPTFQMVTISRASRIIELGELKDLILDRLENKFANENGKGQLVIKLPPQLKKIHVDSKIQGTPSLSSLDWSNRTGRFTARFALAGADPIILKGTANLMIEVAVAKNTIARGKTLTRNDIEMKFINTGQGRQQLYTGIGKMIGLSTKRRLQRGKPIYVGDLEPPKLIIKNQLVTILLEVPGLVLRTQGKALADATKGETVRILNTQSKRIIHATAKASGLVSVTLAGTPGSGS
jgi:flagella basal body P-ring formation protein FlgA